MEIYRIYFSNERAMACNLEALLSSPKLHLPEGFETGSGVTESVALLACYVFGRGRKLTCHGCGIVFYTLIKKSFTLIVADIAVEQVSVIFIHTEQERHGS